MANNTTGFTRIIKAAGYSWKGLRAAWINEAAFRQEGVAVLLAVVIACWLDVDAITRVLLISTEGDTDKVNYLKVLTGKWRQK